MSRFVDRRLNSKNKSAVNRQRFLQRFHGQIRKAVADAISKRSVTDIDSGEKVKIPARDISEPLFRHGPGGRRQIVHPGNKKFVSGDRVPRPESGSGSGGKASNTGEGEDDFVFELTREEFLEYFFEDLELPNLVKTQLARDPAYKSVRAGYTQTGVQTNLHVIRSLRGALARRMALSAPYAKQKRELEEELETLLATQDEEGDLRIAEIRQEIEQLEQKILGIPFIDTFDLRFRNRVLVPLPSTQAVMFCLMDVSGSMDQDKKDLAKRFFLLLYLFLTRNYERTDVVFIRHHTVASEVDEEEFFYSRETGGTVVSSALDLMRDIVHERYASNEWNIYAAQASDGDNWPEDSGNCSRILSNELMPLLQYYAYIEIDNSNPQSLWNEYEKVAGAWPNFAMRAIGEASEIYPVFRELFKKQHT